MVSDNYIFIMLNEDKFNKNRAFGSGCYRYLIYFYLL